MKKLYFLFIMLVFACSAFAQKENNIWYFGNQAGLDFNSGTPFAITNGVLTADDNTASVANPNTGALLFYSNGNSIWNANHTIMPNGSGILGNYGGGTCAFAVKQPGNNNNYYLFTTDGFAGSSGLRYSVIDMNLNSGLGDVTTTKNVQLYTPSTEKICAVRHSNNTDVWIVTHPFNSGSFKSYLLSSTGLNTIPVISTVGATHTGSTNNACGQMAASPQGDKICCAIYDIQHFELFDFDKSTGTLSNVKTLSGYSNSWGVAFSPSGNILYVTQWYGTAIKQFDLSSGNAATIAASVTTVGNVTGSDPSGYRVGYLQLGPDHKIYASKFGENNIAVINNPDVLGTGCNFTDIGVLLGTKHALAGLPTFWNFNNCDTLIYSVAGPLSPCGGTTQSYYISPDTSGSYTWTVPPGWTILSGQGSDSITVIVGSSAGSVVAAVPPSFCNLAPQSLAVTLSGALPLQPSAITGPTGVCESTIQTYSVIDVVGVTYTWSVPSGWAIVTGQGTNSITVTTSAGSGNVSVVPSNLCGDGIASTLAVSILPIPTQPTAITGSASPCAGTSTTYSVPAASGVNFTWTIPAGWVINSGQGTNSINVTPTSSIGTISVVAYNICDTTTAQTLVVTPEALPSVSTHPANFSICAGGMATFDVSASGATSYQWQVNNGGGWVNISAAGTSPVYSGWTTSVLFINQTPFTANTWKYRCVVLNTCGAVLSSFATLTVIPATITNVYDSLCKGDIYVLPGGGTTGNAGTFTDTLASYQGCDSIVILHLHLIDIDISVTPGTGSLTANVSPATYQWFNCNTGAIIPGETSQTFTPVDSGHYAVIINQEGCVDTSSCYQVIPLGISNADLNENFSVFPNPAGNNLTVKTTFSNYTICVFDAMGRIVIQPCYSEKSITHIDLRNIENGVYYLQLIKSDLIFYKKIIKQN
ncbi:MAG: T9SS type A sorting domain-containing protein [Bacteroidota bacterium]